MCGDLKAGLDTHLFLLREEGPVTTMYIVFVLHVFAEQEARQMIVQHGRSILNKLFVYICA